MKIAVLATELSPMPGGIQRYTHRLAKTLGRLVGPKNVLVLPFDGVYTSSDDFVLNDAAAQVRLGVLPRRWRQLRKAKAILSAFRPDLIVSNHVALAPLALWTRRRWNVPYWVAAYGIDVWMPLSGPESRALLGADRVLSISEVTERILLEKGVSPERLRLLFYGLDTELYKPAAPAAGEGPLLLTVCRLDAGERYKGYDRVIEALPALARRFPGVRYRIVGDGTDRPRVEQLAADLGVRNRFQVTGFIRDEAAVVRQYQASDLFVMPSLYQEGDRAMGEGFGFVYLEAAACGKPVVAGNGGGCREAVADGTTGILVDPTDSRALFDAIAGFLGDPARARAFGEAGRRRVEERFSVHRFEEDLRRLLER